MAVDLIVNCTLALAQNSVLATLGAPADPKYTQQGGLYQMPSPKRLLAMAVVLPDPLRVQIDTPTLRAVALPNLDPVNPSLPLSNRPAIWTAGPQGVTIKATEEYRILVSRAGAGVGDAYAVSWLADSPPVPRVGNSIPMYFTSSVVTANGAWAFGPLTPDVRLPPGSYDVVGMQTYGANVLASRLIFSPDMARPGNIGRATFGTWNDDTVRSGRMGVLGTFTNYTVPQIEVFGYGATGTQVTILDVVPRLS